MNVYKRIGDLQGEFNPDSCAYEIGEQLKDICRRDPACEAILLEDLQNPSMGLAAADKMLYDWGRNHKVGNCCGISGRKAEELLREFYGLPAAGAAAPALRPLIKGQAEKLIASLHSNFDIDYV